MTDCNCNTFPASLGNVSFQGGASAPVGMALSVGSGYFSCGPANDPCLGNNLHIDADNNWVVPSPSMGSAGWFFPSSGNRVDFYQSAPGGGSIDLNFCITPGGRVGIGVVAPQASLDVAGAAGTVGIRLGEGTLQVGSAYLSAGPIKNASLGNNLYMDAADNWVVPDPSMGTAAWLFNGSGNRAEFWQGAAGGSVDRTVAIAPGGKVGVGVPLPQAMLDVAGAPFTAGIHLGGGTLQVGGTPQAGLWYSRDSGDLYVGGDNAQDGDLYIRDLAGTVRISLKAENGASLQIGNTSGAGLSYSGTNGSLYVGGDNGKDGMVAVLSASGEPKGHLSASDASLTLYGRKVADSGGCFYAD